MDKKNIIIGILGVLGLFVFLYAVYILINKPTVTFFPEINVIKENDHVKWASDKKNILVAYSDFQCPACREFHNILNQMESSTSADFGITKKVTFVYRHFPLYQIHQNAYLSSYAAEAAGAQGKFFEMSDLLFSNQDKLEASVNKDFFISLAKQLNLDINKFTLDMDSKKVKDKVDADLLSGEKVGVNSTPTFFLNGKKVDNVGSFDQFKALLKSL